MQSENPQISQEEMQEMIKQQLMSNQSNLEQFKQLEFLDKEQVVTDFNEYLKLAVATSSTLEKDTATRLLHSTCGIIGELGELATVMFKEEAITEVGDVLWNIAEGFDAITKHAPDHELFKTMFNPPNVKPEDPEYVNNTFDKIVNFVYTKTISDCPRFNKMSAVNGVSLRDEYNEVIVGISHLLDEVKKAFFYGKGITEELIAIYVGVTPVVLTFLSRYLDFHFDMLLELDAHEYSIKMVEHNKEIKDLNEEEAKKVEAPVQRDMDKYSFLLKVANANILKLKARFPDGKFDLDKSNNRDYQKESESAGVKGE